MTPRMPLPRRPLPEPYKVEIIEDSLAPSGSRLTTFVLTYWRAVHAELLTHRTLSKSSASSRAIPPAKMRELVRKTPALPVWWGKNQSGMQAREELSDDEERKIRMESDVWATPQGYAKALWRRGMEKALRLHEELEDAGLHKQICNRILEPWMPITVIVSGTEWENFFHLRDHKDAQPELQVIATEMHYQYREHEPRVVGEGVWHLPFVDLRFDSTSPDASAIDAIIPEGLDVYQHDQEALNLACRISAARCARVSYLTHEGRRDIEADLKLYDRLVMREDPDEPMHLSPLEHVAQALGAPLKSGNFTGWSQLRKQIVGEAGPR